ncbi:MAG: hypothetical protein QGD95_02955 [Actinomycetota bacterium]|nr:hypothetical protein [Actinomycetota bacterium]
MLSILVDILAPVFLIVAVGFVVAKTIGVKPEALAVLAGQVLILQMTMPAAVFTSLIALEHDMEPDFVTSVVLIGTLL